MHAAMVTEFGAPPHYAEVEEPTPDDGELLVDVLAAGLHPRVRSGAAGTHYTSTGVLPMVPGIDGVGRLADGTTVYFVTDDDRPGSMAERTVAHRRRTIRLPDDADVSLIAAAMNPAMSSWVALRARVPLEQGQSVLVLGATGSAGRMAIQVAKHLGAGLVVGAGRDRLRLATLRGVGADVVVQLQDDGTPSEGSLTAAADVDVVVDYLWGEPARHAMMALLSARSDRSRALHWIQIGAMAGPTLTLPSAALRSANLQLLGNGQGAISPARYAEELPSLIAELLAGTFDVHPHPVALRDVATAWTARETPGVRTVLIP
jgi:NADPH:quinone reductase-like Zn-dependent oxidoreductase